MTSQAHSGNLGCALGASFWHTAWDVAVGGLTDVFVGSSHKQCPILHWMAHILQRRGVVASDLHDLGAASAAFCQLL